MQRFRRLMRRPHIARPAVLMGAVTVLILQTTAVVADPPRGGDAASVEAEWDCDGVVTVTSEHRALSNVLILHGDGETKVKLEGEEKVFSYAFDADDYPDLWAVDIKAGNNGQKGRGERVLLEAPDCGPGGPVVGVGLLSFKLTWDTEADLDLYVTDPGGTTLYYFNTGPTATGGLLDRDDNYPCGTGTDFVGGVENVFWDNDTSPAAGTYSARVVMGDHTCDPGEINYVLEVFVAGARQDALTRSGTIDPTTALFEDVLDTLTYVHP